VVVDHITTERVAITGLLVHILVTVVVLEVLVEHKEQVAQVVIQALVAKELQVQVLEVLEQVVVVVVEAVNIFAVLDILAVEEAVWVS